MSRRGRRGEGRKRSGWGWALRTDTVAEGLLWLLVLLVPLVFVPTARDSFDLPKRLAGEWLALASVLTLALGAALRGGFDLRRALRLPVVRAVGPVAAVVALGALLGRHPSHTLGAVTDLAVGVAALVGWTALESRRLRRLLLGLLVPATILTVLAALQYHDLFHFFAFAGGDEARRTGVTSLAGNPGHLGAFLALACVVGQAQLAGSRRRRALVGLGVLVSAYGVLLTQTLAALAALALGSLVVWGLRLPRRRAAVATAVAAGLVVVSVIAVAPLRGRVVEKWHELRSGEVNELLTGRLDGWRAAVWMAGRHPLTGVGHGAYAAEFTDAKLALLDRGVPFFRGHGQSTFANAHNEVLEALAEWGWPGLLALAWGLWVLGRAARRLGRDAAREEGAGGAGPPPVALAGGGLAALAVLSLVHFPFRLGLTVFPALLLLAWIFRRAREVESADAAGAGEAEPPAQRGAGTARWIAWGLVAVLAAGLVLHSARSRDLLRASRILNAVQRTTVELVRRGGAPGTVLWAHLRLLGEARQLDPGSHAVPMAEGTQYLLLERPREAAERYRRSLEIEPRPEAWLNLARAQLAAGEPAAAQESFVRAVRLHPPLAGEVPREMRRRVRREARGPGDGAEG